MKHLLKIFSLFTLLIFIACNKEIKQNISPLNGSVLKTLVDQSLQGNSSSSDRLTGLFTFVAKDFTTYNNIFIDSIQIDKKTFYSVLVENQNPIYNLFAIIDGKMNLLLKDESLNGYLNSSWKKSGSKIFAVVDESFRSKDVIMLDRISYYSIDSLGASLVFRQFTKIKTPQKEADQIIVFVSDSSIHTEIFDSSASLKPEKDIFRFNVSRNKYLSNKNKFDTLVVSGINGLNIDAQEPQIIDYQSIRHLLDETNGLVKVDSSTLINDNDFEIKFDNQWKKLGGYTIANLLKKEMKGFKFINTKIGAGISMFKITPNDSLEGYFDKALIIQTIEKKTQRETEEFDDTKNRYKLFEYSCPAKKIILILEAPKATYENYRDIFNNIFKSFKVKC